MKFIIASLLILVSVKSIAQGSDSSKIVYKDKDSIERIFTVVQIPAEFPGGFAAWNKYLQQNLNVELGTKYVKIPKGQKTGKATVLLSFIVDKEGNVSEIIAENNPHKKLVAEAIRVIKEGPKWKPAEQNGKKVTYRHRQSITWQVSEE